MDITLIVGIADPYGFEGEVQVHDLEVETLEVDYAAVQVGMLRDWP